VLAIENNQEDILLKVGRKRAALAIESNQGLIPLQKKRESSTLPAGKIKDQIISDWISGRDNKVFRDEILRRRKNREKSSKWTEHLSKLNFYHPEDIKSMDEAKESSCDWTDLEDEKAIIDFNSWKKIVDAFTKPEIIKLVALANRTSETKIRSLPSDTKKVLAQRFMTLKVDLRAECLRSVAQELSMLG